MNWWLYFLGGVLIYQVIKLLTKSINRQVIEYRQRRFLKYVRISFPYCQDIVFIAIETSDKRAMNRLKRQLQEEAEIQYEVD